MAPRQRAAKKKAPLNEAGLYEYAVKALGRQMRTEAELRRLMKTRAEQDEQSEAAIKSVVGRLKEHGYLDDRSFAETYARLRQENEKLGARRVRQDLQKKGIRSELIAETVEARYGGANEETLARAHLKRKRIRKPDEREGDRARDAAAGGSGVLDGHDLQDSSPVECGGGIAGRARQSRRRPARRVDRRHRTFAAPRPLH